jgi:hypothetical protein
MLYGFDVTKNKTGTVRTKSLFLELSYLDPSSAVFTLKDEDHVYKGRSFTSLSKMFTAMVPSDPTEYDFAETLFGSWAVWETVRKSPLIHPHYVRWKREAEVKVKSEAIRSIVDEMKTGGKSSFSAAKLLLDRGWIEKSTATALAKEIEDKEMNTEAVKLLGEDAERLGLKVN